LFGSRDSAAAPVALRFHAICNRAVWRSLGFGAKLRAAGLAIAWPLTAAVSVTPFLLRNARPIRAITGKSGLRQFVESVGVAIRHNVPPKYYYIFEFYLAERMAKAGDYLLRYETKQVAYRLLLPRTPANGTAIKNKIEFAAVCLAHDLPSVPMLAAFTAGARVAGSGEARLPEGDIFAKRVLGKGGWGAERWNFIGGDRYRSTHGAELSGAGLLEHVARLSQRNPYLLQPALMNHAALRDLSVGALSTVRVLTCRDENGGHEVTNASYRMAIDPTSAVDNIHAGGIAAPIDLATGTLGAASDLGLGPKFAWHESHPMTKARIAGRVLPHWPEVMALAVKAHAAFPEWAVIGWDVAILDAGPRLIEGNRGPDVDLIQRPLRGPIGNGRFGELLVYNLERLEK
jgi:hypothetical protein